MEGPWVQHQDPRGHHLLDNNQQQHLELIHLDQPLDPKGHLQHRSQLVHLARIWVPQLGQLCQELHLQQFRNNHLKQDSRNQHLDLKVFRQVRSQQKCLGKHPEDPKAPHLQDQNQQQHLTKELHQRQKHFHLSKNQQSHQVRLLQLQMPQMSLANLPWLRVQVLPQVAPCPDLQQRQLMMHLISDQALMRHLQPHSFRERLLQTRSLTK